MGLDEELWDILEDDVGDLVIDEEGAVVDRRKHTPTKKKLYKKHHTIRGALVKVIPKAEYMKMSEKSNAKAMFASLCANYKGSKKVRKAKALMLILRSLPARWRPKVEAKDLNTLGVEDLVRALKVESEEESPNGDSDENPTEKMAMLFNKLEYLEKKNMKFLSKRGGYKSCKKEDHKGFFNCKKSRHFIADCPNLQKEKPKDKSKKSNFNAGKFRKQIKKSLMETWEDLDSESDSEKEEAEEDAKVVVGLVATMTSEEDPDSNSKDENEICLRAKVKQKSWYIL
ncbi:hypothetical protein MTR_1g052045 [Medicago truncatula]|uniref:Uncharacterized protein n=1 Tax=Medicago truncatula TaxID=3880 RepID=A0A072VTT7_MEDTR|nr:hypothetical protein MTR_1g052045 [Medicago truncatula]